MELVTEDTIPVLGKYYRVRCAVMKNHSNEQYSVPIIGIVHSDNQFAFPYKHYHIDGRFCGRKERIHLAISDEGTTNQVCHYDHENALYNVFKIITEKRKCKSLTTGLIPPKRGERSRWGEIRGGKYWAWYDSMIGKSCKGKKCPHLGTKMIERDGVLFCPLHNLFGDIKKEVIIKEIEY